MKVHLLFPDRDPRTTGDLHGNNEALVRDLGLGTLFDRMGGGDPFLRDVAWRTLLSPLPSVAEIRWRQAVLEDFLSHPDAARTLYRISVEGLESQKKVRGWFWGQYPSGILSRSVQSLEALIPPLRALRQFADEHVGHFRSKGLRDLLNAVDADLSDDYFVTLEDHLRRLKFPTGVVLTAALGTGCKGTNYVLRKPRRVTRTWRDLLGISRPDELTYRLPDRDEAGARALDELRDRGINLVADALAQSTDHILSFFALLRWEMAFFVGCLHVHDALAKDDLHTVFPEPTPPAGRHLHASGLYELCLALRIGDDVVSNDLAADDRTLIMITGANQGGKSTLLRSIGVAQIMMQAGMFVGADSFRASIARRLHTHFRREEDPGMESGKLDEELARMSQIVDDAAGTDLVLFNESFSSTNEREGSQIARQIIQGLNEADIRVVFVTHMFDLARGLAETDAPTRLFLRPERLADGRRTFRVIEGPPAPTSHAQDIYDKIFAGR